MKTILIDAEEIMASPQPVLAVARLFGLEIDQIEDLRAVLQSRQENILVGVTRWPPNVPGWEEIGDMLEGIQQHSNYFYLIWGTRDMFVDVHAKDKASALVNVPASQC